MYAKMCVQGCSPQYHFLKNFTKTCPLFLAADADQASVAAPWISGLQGASLWPCCAGSRVQAQQV